MKWLKCVENMCEAAAAAPSNVVKLGLPVVWEQGVSLGTTSACELALFLDNLSVNFLKVKKARVSRCIIG